MGLLAVLPVEARHKSFHVVCRDGAVHSASDALSETLGLLPAGSLLSKTIESAPLGSRGLHFLYSTASRVHGAGRCTYREKRTSTIPQKKI